MSSTLIPGSAERPGDDPIFALHAEAERRAKLGESVIDATLGALMQDDGHLAILPVVSEALRRVDPEEAAAYAPISGPPEYLAAVVRDLFGTGPLAERAVAAATPGGTGALHHALVNFLEPGQKALTTSYYWGPYATLADHTRRGLATFNMFARNGRFDTAAFEAALQRQVETDGRALILLNTPCHNPTGYSLDDGEWAEVVRIAGAAAERVPLALLLDLAYAKFGGRDAGGWTEHVAGLMGRATVLVAWTGSKAFAQYGARIGALVALNDDPDERRRIKNALGYSCRGTWSNCNHLGMLAVTSILSDPKLRARADQEREVLKRLLSERVQEFNRCARAAGLSFPRYEGGFFVSVFTPDPKRTGARMQKDGVFVVPISGAVRVAICSTPRADMPRLVDALAAGVREASA